jgi:two-component system, oxyanion-binding sensor
MLSLNGASITVSSALYEEMTVAAAGDLAEPKIAAAAFAKVAAARVAAGAPPPVLATVFTYSTHTLLIVEFLRLANLELEKDIPLVVLPPQYTATSLAKGQIDGFCAGAPWNAVAIASGVGAIAALGVDLIPDAPEKLLVMRADEVERRTEIAVALTRAVLAAADWAGQPDHRERLAQHLARADYVDAPASMIEAVLAGNIEVGAERPPRRAPGYLRIDRDALRPSAAAADRLFAAMIAAGQLAYSDGARDAARKVFRGDLFEQAAGAR